MFVTFEGIDGCGKTTQSTLFAKYLSDLHGMEGVVLTREPGGTSFNEFVRNLFLSADHKVDGMTELLLFVAMRRESFTKVVKPALSAGKIVISDRFVDSTIAYQGYGYGIDLELIAKLNALVVDILPDVTFVIDVNVNEAMSRAHRNGYEREDVGFYNDVIRGFRKIVRENPHRCHLIDCKGDKSNDVYCVHRRIMERFHQSSAQSG